MRASAWSTPPMPRACRPSTPSTATSATWKACCAGAKPRAPWASKAWAASIPCRSRSSTAPLRRRPSRFEKAMKIVAAFEDAQAQGLGVVSLGSKMIDAPVVNRAAEAGSARPADGPASRIRRRRPGMSAISNQPTSSRTPSAAASLRSSTDASRSPIAGVDGHRPTGNKYGAADPQQRRLSRATATSACPISKPRCAAAACATA